MLIADLRMHTLVDTPNGKGKVVGVDTPKISVSEFAWEEARVKVFYEPNKIFPRGTERTFVINDLSPWVDEAAAG